ncbi:MAG: hypothetical protein ACXWQO_01450 [Bdellovibrionota bacterium]
MKTFLAFLFAASVISFSALADKANIEKFFDGKFAHCQVAGDSGHTGYLPSGLTVSSDSRGLSVAFLLEHLKCVQDHDTLSWVPNLHPLEPSPSKDIHDRPLLLTQANTEAVLARGSDASLLTSIEVRDDSQQALNFSFTKEQLLSTAELAALEAGTAVNVRAVFFLRADISVQAPNGETVALGLRAGGAYSISLTLKKGEAGEIQISNLLLK